MHAASASHASGPTTETSRFITPLTSMIPPDYPTASVFAVFSAQMAGCCIDPHQ
jgi:hypothetical protein